jgi:hypothetical protein
MDFDAAWEVIQRNIDKFVATVDPDGLYNDLNTDAFTYNDFMETYR